MIVSFNFLNIFLSVQHTSITVNMTSNKINTPLCNHLFCLPTSALIDDCTPMHIPWSWIKECSLIFYYLALQVCRGYKVASRCTCTTPWTPFPRQYRPATLSSKQSSSSLRLRPPRQAAATQLVKFGQRFPPAPKSLWLPPPPQNPRLPKLPTVFSQPLMAS